MNPLLVSELFLCILDCLTPPPDADYEDKVAWKATLAALARTCRAFSEPSLDHLWRCLDSLLPLFWCFSGFVDIPFGENPMKVPSTPDEWCIVNRYLPRIQELELDMWNHTHYLRLTHFVLPSLKSFKWAGPLRFSSDAHAFAALLPLLTPNVDTLQVYLPNHDDDFESLSFMKDYPRLYPNLKSIKLLSNLSSVRYPRFYAVHMAPLSGILCSRVDWKHVEISYPIDNVTFKHLATSSTLRVVSSALLPNAEHADELFFEPTETPFPNVTCLSLTLWNHLDVATKLLRTRDQAFHNLTIYVELDQTTAMEISPLLAAIPSPSRMHSLRSLNVQRNSMNSRPLNSDGRPSLSYETFLPIASLVHLRELVIDLNHPISIDDHEFAQLVSNWPCLQVLHLMGAYGTPVPPLSLTALTSLASCKDLQNVAITLDARRVVEDVFAHACCPAVTRINFVNCPIEDPELVVNFVTKHVPQARVLSLFAQLPPSMIWDNYTRSWRQVKECVNERMHERYET